MLPSSTPLQPSPEVWDAIGLSEHSPRSSPACSAECWAAIGFSDDDAIGSSLASHSHDRGVAQHMLNASCASSSSHNDDRGAAQQMFDSSGAGQRMHDSIGASSSSHNDDRGAAHQMLDSNCAGQQMYDSSVLNVVSHHDGDTSSGPTLFEELTVELDKLTADSHISTAALPQFSITYDNALVAARRTISALEHPCIFKIGITAGPLHRFYNKEFGYVHEGYDSMSLLLASTPSQCCQLEKALIAICRTQYGGCRNDAPGGENPPRGVHCFTYVVSVPSDKYTAWRVRHRRGGRKRR